MIMLNDTYASAGWREGGNAKLILKNEIKMNEWAAMTFKGSVK